MKSTFITMNSVLEIIYEIWCKNKTNHNAVIYCTFYASQNLDLFLSHLRITALFSSIYHKYHLFENSTTFEEQFANEKHCIVLYFKFVSNIVILKKLK